MALVVTEPCVGCKSTACVEVCPVGCFHEGDMMLYIDPDCCIDCHACAGVCPSEAIYPEADVPARWAHYAALNAEGARRWPLITQRK